MDFMNSMSTAEVERSVKGNGISLRKGSGPAVSRESVNSAGSIDLTKRFDKVGISLSKKGLDGIRAQAYMILDHSGSMSPDYRNGTVQVLVERALAFALQVDIDGEIPVLPFDSKNKSVVNVNLNNFSDVVNREIYKPNNMGGTNLTAALEELLKEAKKATDPIFAIIITDGQPNNAETARKVVIELANYPVFIKFLTTEEVAFTQELDDISDSERLLDNVDTKYLPNPANISDLNFADAMVEEWDSWINLAQNKGVLN